MFSFGLLLLGISLAKSEIRNVTVKTETGTVVGNSYYFNGREIHRFLGIPFAKPPVGELRFLNPQPVEPWPDPLIAQTFPAACIQCYPHYYPWVDKQSEQSEDCLYLNIWTPKKKPCKKAKKAVMFWIFSGGFNTGSNSEPVYDGQVLAAYGDVIVVTVNYRIGILGFLYAGTENAAGNMGLFDVLTALKWVNDNIEAFGGDKNRITLFGNSAGSVISALFTMAPLAKGLFQRIILESGSPFLLAGITQEHNVELNLKCECFIDLLDPVPYKYQITDHYLSDVDEYDYEAVRKRAYNSVGDLLLTCPTMYLLESFSQKKNKTYMYYFNHHSWNTVFAPWMGATHFTEVQFVFGRPLDSPYKYSPAEVELSKQVLKMWTDFAKKGLPSAKWKQYSKLNPYIQTFYIDGEDQTSTLNEHLKNCEFLRPYMLSP